ncbi:GPI mannosyltransferase 1 [Exophiala dermatitidis]|uniref:GPI mannosyltransferase 1 n=2 Tax=Exophiala dermatitidis TaxID=5970 RepID=H6BMG1_EXODN|nr:phosphatidylinositol glycan, class M [Exophiala dermatitidis NIH/UT8656]KAJ4514705.1 GPI mannosyltransferase 1 [Exophiala dermatitidis]EHY52043.1 phosphatidylinositol glycan, class M [Exophiala dermatitidis NIH/UT8656]KAJ4518148.1 GPI mannosyltransferase 1 [Exophiala dermatitidis]KAJ4521046.1 GPI mannosyltransferase 1 [Exophiala dermatitidis]KAJ4547629.1 GPI mannosyltransferase 1 [Exophiala dermatitidis]
MPSLLKSLFSSRTSVFTTALLLRAILLVYGVYQDSVSAIKYTDIDYYVFTDAARAVARHSSPYDRATYRYTPLLSWILLPTSWGGHWFHFGKVLFALSDLIAGWLILMVMKRRGLEETKALKYASVWLLNPMVANISTRGSSEGFLCVLVMALLWAFETKQIALSGTLLGVCVHFKIYPFIYGASMLWALETPETTTTPNSSSNNTIQKLATFLNEDRILLISTSLLTFTALNVLMYNMYGPPFLQHTFLHHLTRIDHRHNFSPYNTLLYLSSAQRAGAASAGSSSPSAAAFSSESLAFVPQLLLSACLIPLAMAKRDLPAAMLAQTLAFVTFNKVCTSQYFLWYLIFLPLYMPASSLTKSPALGLTALLLWVLGQAAWLQQAYQLEFLGRSTFVPGLFAAGLAFFAINCWILGLVAQDVVDNKPVGTPARGSGTTSFTSTKSTSGKGSADDETSPTRPATYTNFDISGIASVHLGPRNRVLKST